MSILDKKTKTPRKVEENNKLNNTKYQNLNERGPVFTISLPGGLDRPPAPRQLRHCL